MKMIANAICLAAVNQSLKRQGGGEMSKSVRFLGNLCKKKKNSSKK